MTSFAYLRSALWAFAFAAASFVPASVSAQPAPLHAWDFSQSRRSGETIQVPNSAGGPALLFRDGADLAADPDENGRLVVILSGSQGAPGRGSANLDVIPEAQIRVRFRPAASGPVLQTVLLFGGCYELRYNRERSRLEFIVYHLLKGEKKYFSINAEIAPEVWNQAVATFKDGKLTLSVGLSRSEGSLPPEAQTSAQSTSIRVGFAPERAFQGSVSEIAILKP